MLFLLLSIVWYTKTIQRTAGASPEGANRETISGFSHLSSLIPHPSSCYWLSLVAFIAAMLSKGSAATLPFILLAIVWWLRPLTKKDFLGIVPFVVITAVLAVLNVWFQGHGSQTVVRSANFLQRLLGAGGVVWFYLFKGLWPIGLLFVYPQWRVDAANPLWWPPLLSAFIITIILWQYRKTWARPLLFAWVVFGAALAPVMGFTDVGFMQFSLVADRYQHIAIIVPIALAAAVFSAWFQQLRAAPRWSAALVLVFAVAALAFLAWRQSSLYRDPITLYQATLQKNPDSWLLHNNLGNALHDIGREDLAIEQYQLTLQLRSDSPQILNNLGNALDESGDPARGIEYLKKSLQLKPDYPAALYNLGNALMHTARYNEALGYYQEALRLKSDYPEAYLNWGNALVHLGRWQEAIEKYNQALQIQPDNAVCWWDLALANSNMRQSGQAVACAQKALELARSQHKMELAGQIGKWLDSHRPARHIPRSNTLSNSNLRYHIHLLNLWKIIS